MKPPIKTAILLPVSQPTAKGSHYDKPSRTFLRIAKSKSLRRNQQRGRFIPRSARATPRYDPDMPKSVKVGKRATAWLASEIAAYQQILISRSREAGK